MHSEFQKAQIAKINATYGISEIEKSEEQDIEKSMSEDIKSGFIGTLPSGKKLHVDPYSEFNKGFDRTDHLDAIKLYKSFSVSSPSLGIEISNKMNAHGGLADASFNKSLDFDNYNIFKSDKPTNDSLEFNKSEEVTALEKGGEGSKGGKVIGHTKSGNPIYAGGEHEKGSFKIGEKYKTDSGMGGTFNVDYKGFKDGKHHFKNTSKGFAGGEYKVHPDAVEEFAKPITKEPELPKVKKSETLDLLNNKNKELVLVKGKLDDHISGSQLLEENEVSSLRDKKEILQQVIKKLESKSKIVKSEEIVEDKTAIESASEEEKEEITA